MTEPDEELTQLEVATIVVGEVARHRRQRCSRCEKRRVLFSLRMHAHDTTLIQTQRLCAECAGIR
jgi:hypothetical protein